MYQSGPNEDKTTTQYSVCLKNIFCPAVAITWEQLFNSSVPPAFIITKRFQILLLTAVAPQYKILTHHSNNHLAGLICFVCVCVEHACITHKHVQMNKYFMHIQKMSDPKQNQWNSSGAAPPCLGLFICALQHTHAYMWLHLYVGTCGREELHRSSFEMIWERGGVHLQVKNEMEGKRRESPGQFICCACQLVWACNHVCMRVCVYMNAYVRVNLVILLQERQD